MTKEARKLLADMVRHRWRLALELRLLVRGPVAAESLDDFVAGAVHRVLGADIEALLAGVPRAHLELAFGPLMTEVKRLSEAKTRR